MPYQKKGALWKSEAKPVLKIIMNQASIKLLTLY